MGTRTCRLRYTHIRSQTESKRLDVSPFTFCKELGAYIAGGGSFAHFSPTILSIKFDHTTLGPLGLQLGWSPRGKKCPPGPARTVHDEVSPSARVPKRGAGSSTARSAEVVRSEPSPSLPDLRSRSPALFQNCGGIIERFAGHDRNALFEALLGIGGHTSTVLDTRG